VFTYSRAKDLVDLVGRQLLARRIGDALDDLAELDLQQARQRKTVVSLEQVRDAALARLAVHANHGVVGAAEIRGSIGRYGTSHTWLPFAVALSRHASPS
jgi:hypothetical protein